MEDKTQGTPISVAMWPHSPRRTMPETVTCQCETKLFEELVRKGKYIKKHKLIHKLRGWVLQTE